MTKTLLTVLCGLAAVGGLALLLAVLRSGRPLRNLLLSAVSGLAALLAVNALGTLAGISLAVNWFSLGVSAAGGAPGVISLLLADVIFTG
ncbi:MAG: pro-sigmaK processing inhibitor BofA family protein [Oscillospiraceae bacterium]|jgi:hypothetical protein|nr:pro-sigmaK processing inhibitor BofA family protein [Oscillospiraceae bacterium]